MILAIAIAAVVFWIAFDGGSYTVESRATVSIAAWWTILMAVVLGLWPAARPPRAALLTGGLLAAFCTFTALSIAWATSAERAFTEFNRVALYLAVFLVTVLASTRGNVGRWLDGIAAAVAATGLLALASRLFPDTLPTGQVPEFLPAAVARLSWPVEYWNGLAILIGIALPLLLRGATETHAAWWRGLALAPLPGLVAAMYLTSSRGGFATGAVGLIAFSALTPRRWPAVAAVAVGGVASAAAIAVLLTRDALVNDPFSAAAADEGRSAALLLLALCAGTGVVYGLAARFAGGVVRVPSLAGRVATILVVLAALIGIAASDPVERFETFRQPPVPIEESDFVRAHLLSGNGSGRWQFWKAAAEQFSEQPIVGHGAGSYEAWWAANGTLAMFIRDAHSLYLEVLGELGVIGFLVLGAALLAGGATGARRYLAADGDERLVLATLLAAFAAYLLAAGIDWIWELTVVSIVGVVLLGLLTGPATGSPGRPRLIRESRVGSRRVDPEPRSRHRFAAGIAAVTVAWLLICAQAIPLLANIKIEDSQAASRAGDAEAALDHADAARNLQPWAASPYMQLALVREAAGDLDGAERSIREAIERDASDWRLWLVAARVETRSGDVAEAQESLRRAAALNPRSPLFANVEGRTE